MRLMGGPPSWGMVVKWRLGLVRRVVLVSYERWGEYSIWGEWGSCPFPRL